MSDITTLCLIKTMSFEASESVLDYLTRVYPNLEKKLSIPSIKECLNPLSIRDLSVIEKEDLISSVPKVDSLSMIIVANRLFENFIKDPFYDDNVIPIYNSCYDGSTPPSDIGAFIESCIDGTTLCFNNSVIATSWACGRKSRLTIKEIEEYVNLSGSNTLSKIETITLAYSGLYDPDMEHIVKFIRIITAMTKDDHQLTVYMGRNHFDSIDDKLVELLNLPIVETTDIVGNPIASAGHYAFYKKLSVEQLKKLIFIPEAYVESGEWRVMFNSDIGKIMTVLETHRAYYK